MVRRHLVLLAACGILFALTLPLVASADSPPQTPHKIDGREACTMCHKVGGIGVGVPGGIGMPNDHLNRSDNICLSCHPAAPGMAPVNSATAVATATVQPTPTVKPTATATTSVAAGSAGKAQAALAAPADRPSAQSPAQSSAEAPSASLPSAGEPLEDAAKAAPFFALGIGLLLGAGAIQRLLGRTV